jgi:hypothetical protein
VSDDLIFEHLQELSKGQLELGDEFRLNTTNDILSLNKKKKVVKAPPSSKGQFKKKKMNKPGPKK